MDLVMDLDAFVVEERSSFVTILANIKVVFAHREDMLYRAIEDILVGGDL